MKVDAKEEMSREENKEIKYHKIHIFLDKEIKHKGLIGKDKTVLIICVNLFKDQTQFKIIILLVSRTK